MVRLKLPMDEADVLFDADMLTVKPTFRPIGQPPPPGLPRDPLTPQQQADALRRIQAQAEERVRLGLQLLKATEGYTARQRQMIDQLRAEQEQLRQHLENDIAKTLQTYDQWMAKFDAKFTAVLQQMERRLDDLASRCDRTEQIAATLLQRVEQLLSAGSGGSGGSQAKLGQASPSTSKTARKPKPARPSRSKGSTRPVATSAAPTTSLVPTDIAPSGSPVPTTMTQQADCSEASSAAGATVPAPGPGSAPAPAAAAENTPIAEPIPDPAAHREYTRILNELLGEDNEAQ